MRLKKALATLIEQERVCRVATANPSGIPHVVPVCHVLADGKLYFGSAADAKKVVNRRGAGADEQFALEGEAGKPLFIGIARKLDAKKDPKEQALQGLEDPYELVINPTDK